MVFALIVVGILVSVSVTSLTGQIQKGAAQAAQNNLLVILAAEKSYHFNHGGYCLDTGNCADTLADINTNLSLNISDTYYTYLCSAGPAPSAFCCYATGAQVIAPQCG
jgi:type II secretory pathway pseudopilin PulG